MSYLTSDESVSDGLTLEVKGSDHEYDWDVTYDYPSLIPINPSVFNPVFYTGKPETKDEEVSKEGKDGGCNMAEHSQQSASTPCNDCCWWSTSDDVNSTGSKLENYNSSVTPSAPAEGERRYCWWSTSDGCGQCEQYEEKGCDPCQRERVQLKQIFPKNSCGLSQEVYGVGSIEEVNRHAHPTDEGCGDLAEDKSACILTSAANKRTSDDDTWSNGTSEYYSVSSSATQLEAELTDGQQPASQVEATDHHFCKNCHREATICCTQLSDLLSSKIENDSDLGIGSYSSEPCGQHTLDLQDKPKAVSKEYVPSFVPLDEVISQGQPEVLNENADKKAFRDQGSSAISLDSVYLQTKETLEQLEVMLQDCHFESEHSIISDFDECMDEIVELVDRGTSPVFRLPILRHCSTSTTSLGDQLFDHIALKNKVKSCDTGVQTQHLELPVAHDLRTPKSTPSPPLSPSLATKKKTPSRIPQPIDRHPSFIPNGATTSQPSSPRKAKQCNN